MPNMHHFLDVSYVYTGNSRISKCLNPCTEGDEGVQLCMIINFVHDEQGWVAIKSQLSLCS